VVLGRQRFLLRAELGARHHPGNGFGFSAVMLAAGLAYAAGALALLGGSRKRA
jgi:hypothetical protein